MTEQNKIQKLERDKAQPKAKLEKSNGRIEALHKVLSPEQQDLVNQLDQYQGLLSAEASVTHYQRGKLNSKDAQLACKETENDMLKQTIASFKLAQTQRSVSLTQNITNNYIQANSIFTTTSTPLLPWALAQCLQTAWAPLPVRNGAKETCFPVLGE
jgi:hypothetical protein